jgi:hypothetical protein
LQKDACVSSTDAGILFLNGTLHAMRTGQQYEAGKKAVQAVQGQ